MRKYILLLIFAFQIFFFSCSNDKKRSDNSPTQKILLENPWLKQFISEFFLDSGALYTVFGSKPITSVEIIYASEDQWKLGIEEKFKDQPEFKQKALSKLDEYYKEYRLKDHWNNWLEFIKNYPASPFMFGEYPSEVPEIKFGYILNKQETLWTVINYKHLFQERLKMDFEPITLINEFGQPSQLWEKIISDDLLSGLLYGYGLRNSELFVLRKKLREEKKAMRSYFSQVHVSTSVKKVTLANLPLPMMTSFQLPFDNDPIVREYENQRKRIQQNLTDKNLYEKVLQQILYLND